jgi:hypothetical protein
MPFYTSNQSSKKQDLYSDSEKPSPMQLVLQQLADEDRIRVKRYAEGHSTGIITADYSSYITVEGWLSAQDMCEGWIQKYSLWTEEADNNCIRIRLMIETDVVPDLPDFEGCENNALCNLDDFHAFTITIKREYVEDELVDIHESQEMVEYITMDALTAFIDSHQRGLIVSLYHAIDEQKKDNVRYFIETIVHAVPEEISQIFCEIISRIGVRARQRKPFNDEYIFPILQYLLDNGADINHQNVWGDTPLLTSISFGTIEMQLFLMAVPTCNLNYKNYKSSCEYRAATMTPLLTAIRWENIDGILALILDPRTNVHLSSSKFSPLSLAQTLKNDIIVQALLDHGA